MATADVRRMIQQVFVRQLRVHPLTFATAVEMYRPNDIAVNIVASWWMAFKVEEMNTTLTVGDLHRLFPFIVDRDGHNVRTAERVVLERMAFFIPYHNRMREIYNRLPADSADQYHEWLITLQEYGVIHMFSAPHWVQLLTPILKRTGMLPAMQILVSMFRRRHRQHLCPHTPRLTYRSTTSSNIVSTIRKRWRRDLSSIRIIETRR